MAGRIPEGPISRGGPCHCGKVGLYAVPHQGRGSGRGFDFFCADHREEANTLMRERHNSMQDRRTAWYDEARQEAREERSRDMARQKHQKFEIGGLSKH